MKNTPNLSANGVNGNSVNGSSLQPQPLSKLLDEAKKTENGNGSTVKQPTTYPAPKVEPAAAAQVQGEQPKVNQPQALTIQAEPEQPAANPLPEAVKRSRSEEITFQIEKAQKLQSINNQLVSLRGKLADLKQFSYRVDEDDNHSYGRLAIYDDANHEFTCKHHGLAEMVVEFLMTKFETKIEEKENELLAVSAW